MYSTGLAMLIRPANDDDERPQLVRRDCASLSILLSLGLGLLWFLGWLLTL
jgi:hypothetical protein